MKDTEIENLSNEFQNPPNSARPRVWWHWMNGNVTKDGIRKDLEWMHRVGIGGFQNFDAGMATPQVVEKKLTFMTPEWKNAFRFATQLADSLGLEMAIAGSPGWSESGGPWVAAKDGMKKLVWSEIRVKSDNAFNGVLPQPYKTTGHFQNLKTEDINTLALRNRQLPEYYRDIAVVAYPLPVKDVSLETLKPKISSSGGNFTLEQLTDGDLATTCLLPKDSIKGYAWIQFEFQKPVTIKALTVVGGGIREEYGNVPPPNKRSLEISDDGVSFRLADSIPLGGVEQQTMTIPPATAKYFRINFKNPELSGMARIIKKYGGKVKEPAGTNIAEIVLHTAARINHAEEKAGFAATPDLEQYPTPVSSEEFVDEKNVIDLTNKMKADGSLSWTPPIAGREWKIMRFGYSLTGKQNHPASPEATGLEVDKMDAEAVRNYFVNYLNQYKDATGGLMGKKGLQYVITDSYEAGQGTWTAKMTEEFQKRRGYSLLPWMPVLTGQVIQSTEASEQFLWDWRLTISELIAENHYDQLTDILQEYGMHRYSESHENGRVYLVDGMDVKRTAEIPMSAMWMEGSSGSSLNMAQADIRESASVAHIYGQNMVAAESFTVNGIGGKAWAYSPENIKPTADLELANGLNRFIIHTSVHQPVDDKIPGLGLAQFGQWFTRHETWAEQAKPWINYLARSSYMLQQGKFVADIVYYYGEDNNITGLFGNQPPPIPQGYNYDFINPHALINLLEVKKGKLVTPSGMVYQMLVLDKNSKRMSLPVLRKLALLADKGAVIVGERPQLKAGREGDEAEFQKLVSDIWDSGRQNIHEELEMGDVLTSLNIGPDFTYKATDSNPELLYVHRKLADTDIYWINSRSDHDESVTLTFRVSGKKPELWNPETGKREDVSYTMNDVLTEVPLQLSPHDAVFVVFNQPVKETSVSLPVTDKKEIVKIEGAWDVSFQPGRGAPATSVFDNLISYTEHPDDGIKYFSGTATYTKEINVPENDITGDGKLILDLGDVKNLAEVTVNGIDLGVVWKKPFELDVTSALKAGNNKLEIKVTNLWVNRLIGDMQPDAKEKIAHSAWPFYRANSPLQTSGLLGSVKLFSIK
ncbi:glycosyl hydrolase [uncultured Draconibacterium sp.]|uniref:glycosyl hydrolase n=1 Tax=uncultured Draconibacterium sp. TaxID=1573823 RepID=UPI00321622C0